MKKIFTIFAAVIVTASVFAQSPEKMSYQAVIRDASGELVNEETVSMQISILQTTVDGTAIYTETQSKATNANGLVSIEIGTGTSSDDFSAIDWSSDTYFIITETDIDNDGTYDVEGISQLLSVPYALHAKTAETITGDLNETDPVFDVSIASAITASDTTNWNNKLDTEVDGSVTNELQTLSVSNDTIYLSNGGFAKLPAQQQETKTYAVGDTAFGGIVFYVNDEGTHGLVAAKTDQAYDGSDLGTLVDYNEALLLCSDTSRFDEQGQQYFDWRLPTVNEMAILQSYYTTGNDLLDVLQFAKDSDAKYYWCSDVHIVDDVSSYDEKVYTRRYYAKANSHNLGEGYEDLEYDCNVRCVKSF